jgi:hypothetical protein
MSEIVGACLSQYHDDEDKFELLLAYADGREIGHTVSRASAKKIAAEFASEFGDTPPPQPNVVGGAHVKAKLLCVLLEDVYNLPRQVEICRKDLQAALTEMPNSAGSQIRTTQRCGMDVGSDDRTSPVAPPSTIPNVVASAIEAVWRCSLVIESSVRRGDGPSQYAEVAEALKLIKQARAALSSTEGAEG